MDYIPQTPFERMAPLRNDVNRRRGTFNNWPVTAVINPDDLCNDQFYYTGLDDKVQCTYCGGILSDWSMGDDVHAEHERHFPDCPWIRQCRAQPSLFNNVCNQGPLSNPQLASFNFSHRAQDGSNISSTYTTSNHPNDRPGVNRPKYPEYSMEMTRVQSYKGWPSQIKQRPEILSKAGFFYMNQGDKCKCFYCGGILYDWEPEDDIWEEHAKWFPECPFLKLVKGDNYINDVQRALNAMQIDDNTGSQNAASSSQATVPKSVDDTTPTPSASGKAKSPAPAATGSKSDTKQNVNSFTSVTNLEENEQKDIKAIMEENEKLKKQKECKICMSEDATTVFLPCGHLVCCPGCAVSVKDCPMCRANIDKVVRVYQ